MQTASRQTPKVNQRLRFIHSAKKLLLQRRVDQAITLLRRGLELGNDNFEARLLLCKTLVGAGRLTEAREELELLLERTENREAYVLLVRILLARDDPYSALILAERALRLFANDATLEELVSLAEFRLSDMDLEGTTEREDTEDLPTEPMRPALTMVSELLESLSQFEPISSHIQMDPEEEDTQEGGGAEEDAEDKPTEQIYRLETLKYPLSLKTLESQDIDEPMLRLVPNWRMEDSFVFPPPRVRHGPARQQWPLRSTERVAPPPPPSPRKKTALPPLPCWSLSKEADAKIRSGPQPKPPRGHAPAPARSFRRWFLLITLAVVALCMGSLAGQQNFHQWRAKSKLDQARSLSHSMDISRLRAALSRVQEAEGLYGRTGEAVALAAALHSDLVWLFGESSLRGTRTLTEEGGRLGAAQDPRAAEDLARARALQSLIREPLSDALHTLTSLLESHPRSTRLKVLYAEALLANRELSSAQRLLDNLPSANPRVLLDRARLLGHKGRFEEATKLLQSAASRGLPPWLSRLEIARLQVQQGAAAAGTLTELKALLRSAALPQRQRAWAHLLRAEIHYRLSNPAQGFRCLDRALSLPRPAGDSAFHNLAGRLLLSAGRLTEARTEATAASNIQPEDPANVALLAQVDLVEGQPRAALSRLSAAAEADPGSRAVRRVLANILRASTRICQGLPRQQDER